MTVAATNTNIDSLVAGIAVRPADDDYDDLRRVFNGMIDRRPALIIRCKSARDVVDGLAYARAEGLGLSVRAGGHGVTGNAVIDGAVCLDQRPMKDIVLDPERGRAVVGAGVNWGELDATTQTIGMAVTGGRVRDTGVAGLTLGSGSGWLERKLGLTCDSLLSVEIVTADGEVLIASEVENSELFWGVRGGGGNFGVVTKFEFQLHDVGPQVYGGLVMYPPFQPVELVKRFRDFMASAPEEIGAGMAFISAPDEPFVPEFARGRPVIACVLAYFGNVPRAAWSA
jgi:FAD/FMN-containing dehydrogenase